MRLAKITVSNFMSFGPEVEFNLPDVDDYMVLVRGTNGQGKSALFEAIYWCLTGTTVRGVKAEEVLRHGMKECVVEVSWELAPKVKEIGPAGTYTIRRLWSKANKQITVERPGKLKQKVFHNTNDGTKYIKDLIGIDPEVLALVSFFGRKFQTFSRMKPTERAHIIDLLADAATWEATRKLAGQEARNRKAQEVEVRRTRDRSKDDLEERLAELEPLKERIKGMASRQKSNVGQLKTRIKEIDKLVDDIKKSVAISEKDLERATKQVEGEKETADKLKTKIAEVKERSRSLSAALQRDQELLDNDSCPTCGQSMEDAHKHLTVNTKDRSEQSRKVDADLVKKRAALRDLEAAIDKVYEDTIDHCEDLLEKWDDEIKVLATEKRQHELDQAQASNDTELARAKERLKLLEKEIIPPLEAGVKEDQERLEDAIDYREAYEFWQEGFKYIRFMIMERTVKGLSALVSSTVLQLGLDADGAEVTLWGADSRGSKKPEIGVYIKRGEYRDPVEALSEGETQRVDLACYIALKTYLHRILGINAGFCVLDEPLTGLDENGKFATFQMMQQLAGQRFVMDHTSSFADLFPEQIEIRKEDGVSAIYPG